MLQYEVSMPSLRINGFAVNKDPREKQKRKREERRKPPRHIWGWEHPPRAARHMAASSARLWLSS